jgi:hypothetical protein
VSLHLAARDYGSTGFWIISDDAMQGCKHCPIKLPRLSPPFVKILSLGLEFLFKGHWLAVKSRAWGSAKKRRNLFGTSVL